MLHQPFAILKAEGYAAKLQDARWINKRDDILKKRGRFCENCKQTKPNIQIHHNFYDRNVDPWDYPDSALKVLCKACHDQFTEALKSFRRDALAKYDVRSIEVLTGALCAVPKNQNCLTFAYAVAWLAAHPQLAETLCANWQRYQSLREE